MKIKVFFKVKFILLILFVLALGCSPKLSEIAPPIKSPESFSRTGDSLVPDLWWTSFQDEKLNQLIDTALTKNLNLKSSWQRIIAAQAQRKSQSTFLLPLFQFGAQTAVSRPEPDFAGGENTQLGVNANYEVDLWGRIKAATQAETFNFQATYYDYQTTALSLSAEVTTVYFQYLIT